MSELSKLKGITPDDLDKLGRQRITKIDALWAQIGKDFERGIDDLAGDSGINRDHLVELLADEADREAQQPVGGKLKRWWPEAVLILIGLLILVSIVRALGADALLPRPLELKGSSLVAVRNLDAGRVLRSGDFRIAKAASNDDTFQTTDQVEGLILSKQVLRNKSVCFGDVLRLQVVAEKDLPQWTVIAPDAVSLKWSNYQPDAPVRLDEVVGYKALRAMRAGDVIVSQFVGLPTP